MQTFITERLVFHKNNKLQKLEEVLADTPCLSCPESMLPQCNVKDGGIEGCPKITAWLLGGK